MVARFGPHLHRHACGTRGGDELPCLREVDPMPATVRPWTLPRSGRRANASRAAAALEMSLLSTAVMARPLNSLVSPAAEANAFWSSAGILSKLMAFGGWVASPQPHVRNVTSSRTESGTDFVRKLRRIIRCEEWTDLRSWASHPAVRLCSSGSQCLSFPSHT